MDVLLIPADARQTLVVAILVLFTGKYLTRRIAFLRNFNIPEPVSGGLLASIVLGLCFTLFGAQLDFDLELRDSLLITFFTTIGLSSKLSTLLRGGKPLLILLVAAVGYLFLQNLTGITAASLTGQPLQIGVLGRIGLPERRSRHGDCLVAEIRRAVRDIQRT